MALRLTLLLAAGGLVAAKRRGPYDEPRLRMDGWMDGWWDVGLDGDWRTCGDTAGRSCN